VPDPSGQPDGKMLQVASGALVYVDAPSGGGGGLLYPFSAPDSPSAYDDEFEGGTLDGKWTEIADPTATGFTKQFAKHGSWLALPNPGAAANQIWDIRQALSGFAAGTAFALTTRLAIRGWNSGTNGRATVSLGSESAFNGGSYLNLTLSSSNGATTVEVYDGNFDVNSAVAYPAAASVFFHLQRAASNDCRIWISSDAFGWRLVNSESRAWDFSYLFV